jgi:hypothetical protein
MRRPLAVLATLAGLVLAVPSQAGHHRWDFTELYSNAGGTVQYVELFSANTGEAGLGPFTVTASGHTFNFVTNLPSSNTANTWCLLATSNFSGLTGGITPDYVIPANFFNTAGGTINYASSADVWAYGAVPVDGVLALQRNGSTAANSPRNFALAAGSVNLSTPVPMLPTWGIVLLVGVLLFAASGLLRRRESSIA